jgi:dCTP deaminase
MILNRQSLLAAAPIKNMLTTKERAHGVSYGLAEAGYDIRIKQEVRFLKPENSDWVAKTRWMEGTQHWGDFREGRFTLASIIEEFQMPQDLVAIVHDKSTWARQGLSVFNTVIEPGWHGFLTLELVFHGNEPLVIPAGAGIAQVIFHKVTDIAQYEGKYQNQEDRPVESQWDKDHG